VSVRKVNQQPCTSKGDAASKLLSVKKVSTPRLSLVERRLEPVLPISLLQVEIQQSVSGFEGARESFRCPDCGSSFQKQRGLDVHTWLKHNRKRKVSSGGARIVRFLGKEPRLLFEAAYLQRFLGK
jgi:hypothetical protein